MTGAWLHIVVPGSLEQRSGGSIYDARMVAGLRRLGRSVTVHSLRGSFPVADAPARTGLATALATIPDASLVVIDGLAMGGLPEVVRPHATRLHIVALVHQLLADVPGNESDEGGRLRELERVALAAASGVITTSAFTARRVMSLGIDAGRIRTVEPGTDRADPAVGPGEDAPPRLLCVAAVTPGKGHDVLVRALARLADLAWTCVCAGSLERDAGFARTVETAARGAGLASRFAPAGEQAADAIDALYRSSSIFVLPSRYESYGMVLTEAMAHGLPIVSTTAGAIPETVPAAAGILVAPGDDDALAAALRQLLMDAPGEPGSAAAARARLGAAGRRHAASLPDWAAAARRFAEAVSALR